MQESLSLLSTDIVVNPAAPSVFHFEFDNFVQFLHMLEGHVSIPTANGTMLRDIEGERHGETQLVLPSMAPAGEETSNFSQRTP